MWKTEINTDGYCWGAFAQLRYLFIVDTGTERSYTSISDVCEEINWQTQEALNIWCSVPRYTWQWRKPHEWASHCKEQAMSKAEEVIQQRFKESRPFKLEAVYDSLGTNLYEAPATSNSYPVF